MGPAEGGDCRNLVRNVGSSSPQTRRINVHNGDTCLQIIIDCRDERSLMASNVTGREKNRVLWAKAGESDLPIAVPDNVRD